MAGPLWSGNGDRGALDACDAGSNREVHEGIEMPALRVQDHSIILEEKSGEEPSLQHRSVLSARVNLAHRGNPGSVSLERRPEPRIETVQYRRTRRWLLALATSTHAPGPRYAA